MNNTLAARAAALAIAALATSACGTATDPTTQSFLAVTYGCKGDGALTLHALDRDSGQIRSTARLAASRGAGVSVFGPARAGGRLLYVGRRDPAAPEESHLQTFVIEDDDKARLVGEITLGSGRRVVGMAVDPTGQFLYIARSHPETSEQGWDGPRAEVSSYRIDDSGLPQLISTITPPLTIVYDLAVSPSGRNLYLACKPPMRVVSVGTIDVDPATAVLKTPTLSDFHFAGSFTVAAHPSGRFVYTAYLISGSVQVHGVDPTTGALTAGPRWPRGGTSFDIAIDPSGRFLYTANIEPAGVWAYTINADTGALTSVPGSAFPSAATPRSVAVDSTGRFLYVAQAPLSSSRENWLGATSAGSGIQGFRIDAATGALTPLKDFPMNPAEDDCPAFLTATP